jgi:uncharacterized membrane protein YhaH (DUF805 family)
VSSNPDGQAPQHPGSYEDYSQGYSQAPQPQYGQPSAPYNQPSGPNSQPSAPTYGQPNYEQPTYGQPDPYGQPTYGQPYTQQYAPAPGYGQTPGYGQAPGYGQGLAPYNAAYDSTPRPSVGMAQAVKLWLKNWKNFSGRASRSEYWWVALALGIVEAVLMVVMFVFVIIAAAVDNGSGSADPFGLMFVLVWGLMGLFGLATVVPSIALGVRRLHDTNQSGWLHLITFVPYVGSIILIVLLAQSSNPAGARFDDAAQPLYGPESL